ncbi:hypothetical protein FPV67DRAFT_1670421 [Lyophyllum atratum]|nr:hypothetical protein FPV67DRAFT_1670421 [Lyophyllum atratum]
MAGLFVGPMPVERFLHDFLPAPDDLSPPPKLSDTFFDDMRQGRLGTEADMWKRFVEYVPQNVIPGFKIVVGSNLQDGESIGKLRPNPTLYRADPNTNSKKRQFNEIEHNFELKKDHKTHPFQDPSENTNRFEHSIELTTNVKGISCRRQLISYATEWFSRQHRCFAFSVYMGNPDMRGIRWDRSGAVVSAKFDYRKNCQPLLHFHWRFTNLDRAGRGWDTTVSPGNPREVELAHKHLAKWKNDLHREATVLTVPDGEVERRFIAWGAVASNPESLTGRCTRAYPVYTERTGNLGFMKDSWRRPHRLEKGSSILRRYHHRMITDVTGHHLKKFSSSREMMQVVSHAFTAHQQSYERCSIIHRDISAYNILITDDGEGILNDWDLAKYEKDMIEDSSRQPERAGTWQFMSCLLLKDKNKRHTIQDDIESFVYIVLYHSMRYLPHNKSAPEVLLYIVKLIFDQHSFVKGVRIGGGMKRALFQLKGDFDDFSGFELDNHPPLNGWIKEAFDFVEQWLAATVKKTPDEDLKGLSLYTHQPMADLFARCLSQPGWPSNDAAVDQLPRSHNA